MMVILQTIRSNSRSTRFRNICQTRPNILHCLRCWPRRLPSPFWATMVSLPSLDRREIRNEQAGDDQIMQLNARGDSTHCWCATDFTRPTDSEAYNQHWRADWKDAAKEKEGLHRRILWKISSSYMYTETVSSSWTIVFYPSSKALWLDQEEKAALVVIIYLEICFE